MPEFDNREEYERWKEARIKQNLEKQQKASAKDPGEEPPPIIPSKQNTDGLTDIDALLNKSWAIFKQRICVLMPLQLLSIAFVLLITLAAAGLGAAFTVFLPQLKTAIIVLSVLVGVTAGMTMMFWPIASMVIAVTDSALTIRDALAAGWEKLWSFIWLFSILGYVIAGGYLLFIVPGVIFTVWFVFSQFILASENTRGMDAMLKSREYVSGRWFDVCLRLLIVWAISIGINLIPLIGSLLSILFAPFMMIYTNLIYEDLKKLKPEPVRFVNTSCEKMKWAGLSTLGYIVLPLIIIAVAGALCAIPLLMLKGMALPQTPQRFF